MTSGQAVFELRPARPTDREWLRRLAGQVFSVYGSYDRYLMEWFDAPGVETYIGEQNGERVGFIMLTAYPHRQRPGEAVADLLAIAVEPTHQGKGFGARLLERAIERAARMKVGLPLRELHLSVAEGNARAQRLFARYGFRRTPEQGLYPAGQRAYHMVLRLESREGKEGDARRS